MLSGRRPFISANLAISADAKIAASHTPRSGWTSKADYHRLIALRSCADALMVGKNTLLADEMSLTIPDASIPPARCIVSRSPSLPLDHPLFLRHGGPIYWLATEADPAATFPAPDDCTIIPGSLPDFLSFLHRQNIQHLHCEGGGSLIFQLAQLDAIDQIHLTLAGHALFGGSSSPTLTGSPSSFLPHSLPWKLTHFEPSAETGECFLSYERIRR